ncbi:MAG: hypothetical protein ABSD08_12705 [Xanthobacteraceae bacterium]|jgi:hypothetical protein
MTLLTIDDKPTSKPGGQKSAKSRQCDIFSRSTVILFCPQTFLRPRDLLVRRERLCRQFVQREMNRLASQAAA